MPLNPVTWPLAGKILGVGVSAVVVGSGVTYAAIGHGGGATPVPAGSYSSGAGIILRVVNSFARSFKPGRPCKARRAPFRASGRPRARTTQPSSLPGTGR
jgi:hypothetical protein